MQTRITTFYGVVLALLTGCATTPASTPVPSVPADEMYNPNIAQATVYPQLTALASAAADEEGSVRQWAVSAEAAQDTSDPRYVASHATGAPDFYPQCSGGDSGASGYGWVSEGGSTNDRLTLSYETPVVPTAIHIYETAPVVGAIIKVEVIDAEGNAITVYEGLPVDDRVCGRIFSIGISGISKKVDRVILHFDRTFSAVWTVRYIEIDAVELVGNP